MMESGSPTPEYSKREQRGWYVYDWANSAFSTTVVTLFLGPYLTSLAKAAAGTEGYVRVLGFSIVPQAVWPYLVSVSVLTQVLALPVLGAIADHGHRKREMLGAFAYTGALATALMYFLEGSNFLLGCVLFLVANFAFGAAVVLYNAFLPEIAPAEQRDAVSSNGWAMGYLGGGLLLALNLLLYGRADSLGLSESHAVRISLASAGLWWGAFTVILLLTLRNRDHQHTPKPGRSYLVIGIRQLAGTLRGIRRYPQTLLFLAAYLIYNDGIQTVITLAGQFGQEELGLPVAALTASILLAQFVALFGAIGFKYLAAVAGNKKAVLLCLAIWSATLVYVYGWVTTATEFYVMSAIVGAVMGGSQALSRSIYSFLIPRGQEAEYFSLYEISDKGTSWLGPLLYGLALQFTGSYRASIISLVLFFVLGFLLLSKVSVRRGALAAGNLPPSIS